MGWMEDWSTQRKHRGWGRVCAVDVDVCRLGMGWCAIDVNADPDWVWCGVVLMDWGWGGVLSMSMLMPIGDGVGSCLCQCYANWGIC